MTTTSPAITSPPHTQFIDDLDFEAERLPVLPRELLEKFNCAEEFDTRFRACARLQQALWRISQNLPIGEHVNPQGEVRPLGSRIPAIIGRRGGNFLDQDVARLAMRECAYREVGAFIDQDRLLTNLLSSQPLCFSLFGPLKLSQTLANAFVKLLFPDLDCTVTQVLFEHSPARGLPAGGRKPVHLGDGTAFDVLIRYRTSLGRRGFIAIEQKYSESMQEPIGEWRPRYSEVAKASDLFVDPDDLALRANPIQQLWREHLLTATMVNTRHYDEGRYVLVAPFMNHHAQRAADIYREHLKPEGSIPFMNVTVERAIEVLGEAGAGDYAHALHQRYCDFSPVDAELDRWLFSEDLSQSKPGRAGPPALS